MIYTSIANNSVPWVHSSLVLWVACGGGFLPRPVCNINCDDSTFMPKLQFGNHIWEGWFRFTRERSILMLFTQ